MKNEMKRVKSGYREQQGKETATVQELVRTREVAVMEERRRRT